MATSPALLVCPSLRVSSGFSVERYSPERKGEWDRFVAANNATFLFHRDYMDYHRERFIDHSLMIFRGAELAAILPANLGADGSLISHEGLTYGGLVAPHRATLDQVMACFHSALRALHEKGIARLRYKRIPSFYNVRPDDDAAYCLFLLDAQLYRRDCALAVERGERLPFQKRRQRQMNRARRANLRIVHELKFSPFWERVLTPRLWERYGVKPVHTVGEITLLASRFPDGIRQFSVYDGPDILAGITIYETPTVAHAQYIAGTDEGRRTGALDYLVGWLLEERYRDKQFFDLGICNEKEGRDVNHGLLEWKQGFGARCYAHEFYEVWTENYPKLEPLLNHGSEPGGEQDPGSARSEADDGLELFAFPGAA
jgi:hypothetical protein